ncbi:S-DNA-T family DNA segregation ATPase FtsK/SpoIIIE [Parabacteroides sp. PFB2-12]|uniref:FtsK/SpoIIIE family DNA translocase n=1 Tax=unclassified Parabacteroides TaxID=2649774 RepID=UPI0024765F9E|nr:MULTISPECIES: DNA translocase FtsK [unclassified Parabacteroides]MDH6342716.1 S-DNA-T family DNA segregation ATPase FtsK/SpoIIIE [Parabacteroides sp. PM6-13]MDH6389779.1 S-DNA-T family DNA segregation ATPase FtsK/SpoIIIE [Parabacteroides sp. PFB2-12]
MAKKKNTKQEKRKEKKEGGFFKSLKAFLANERTQYITGLIICLFTIYIGLALISFFFTGGADQSKIENVPLSDLVAYKGSVENWTGVRGAYLADLLMNQWFGISSFLILIFFGTLGARLMKLTKANLLKRFLFCGSMMIWGSVFLAFLFVKGYEDTFVYLGGLHGYYISEWLISNIGIPGTVLLLLGTGLIIAIFSSKRTVPFLQRLLSFGWMKRKKKKEKPEEPEFQFGENEPEEVMDNPESDIYRFAEDDDHEVTFEVNVPKDEEYIPEIQEEQEPEEDNEEDMPFTVDVPEGDTEEMDPADMEPYDPKLDLSSYRNPSVDLLKKYDMKDYQVDMEEQTANQRRIKQTLENFGINISSIKATVGPTITLYEVIPEAGVRISKIRNLEDDIALSLSALGIRIIAPMPGKGTIGIEVPNKDPQIVSMQSVIASRKFQECKYELPIALGKTITNEIFMVDLCKMPHLLVAGATGQGKSVGLNAIITSLLYKKHPSELKFVMVDPKMVEFSIYAEIERHYLAKLPDMDKAIITDFTKVIHTLNSLCKLMDDRYDLLMKAHTRNIKEYNEKFINRRLNPNKGHMFMPYIVVVIDEFGDLIMTAGKEIEMPIARIAQKARAVGIHMVIATQRPTTNIITGTIKANFPARMAFRVTSMIDSRTILDGPGANQLIGRGDMLFSQGNDMVRVQCAFVDTPEVESISTYIGEQVGFPTAHLLPEYVPEGESSAPGNIDLSDRDPLFDEAARLIVLQQQGSTSLIQRKFAIGYNRAGRLMDQLEAAGIVGAFEGSKARQVLIQDEYSLEQLLNGLK